MNNNYFPSQYVESLYYKLIEDPKDLKTEREFWGYIDLLINGIINKHKLKKYLTKDECYSAGREAIFYILRKNSFDPEYEVVGDPTVKFFTYCSLSVKRAIRNYQHQEYKAKKKFEFVPLEETIPYTKIDLHAAGVEECLCALKEINTGSKVKDQYILQARQFIETRGYFDSKEFRALYGKKRYLNLNRRKKYQYYSATITDEDFKFLQEEKKRLKIGYRELMHKIVSEYESCPAE